MPRQTACRLAAFAVLFLPLLPSPLLGESSGDEQVPAGDQEERPSAPVHRHLRIITTGTAAFGWTDGNRYLFGDEGTEVENGDFTLVMIATPKDKWKFFGQVNVTSYNGVVESTVDYLLAEWTLSNSFKLAFGRGHHPFGNYGDVFRIGILRPLLTLPQGIYGTVGMVGENYTGVTAKGSHSIAESWNVEYDVYAGYIDIRTSRPWVELRGRRFEARPGLSPIDETFGGRLVFANLNGFSFGLSGYRGGRPDLSGSHDVYGAHLQYLSDRWLVRAEVARHDHFSRAIYDGAYLEIAYSFLEKWQVATRYDWADVDVGNFDVTSAPSLWDHRDVTLGLTYWVNTGLALRAEVHDVDGNRFALPDGLSDALLAGDLRRETRLVQFGVQFRY